MCGQAACGVPPPALPAAQGVSLVAGVLRKFETERAEMVTAEIAEIEALQALGHSVELPLLGVVC
jgi:hypothetical protein